MDPSEQHVRIEPSPTSGDISQKGQDSFGFAKACLAQGWKLWDVAQLKRSRPKRKLVLLVQREWLPRLVLQQKLQNAGLKVETASEDREAVNMCSRRTPDGVLFEAGEGTERLVLHLRGEPKFAGRPLLQFSFSDTPDDSASPHSAELQKINLLEVSSDAMVADFVHKILGEEPYKPLALGEAEATALENLPGMLRLSVAEIYRNWESLPVASEAERPRIWAQLHQQTCSVIRCAAVTDRHSMAQGALTFLANLDKGAEWPLPEERRQTMDSAINQLRASADSNEAWAPPTKTQKDSIVDPKPELVPASGNHVSPVASAQDCEQATAQSPVQPPAPIGDIAPEPVTHDLREEMPMHTETLLPINAQTADSGEPAQELVGSGTPDPVDAGISSELPIPRQESVVEPEPGVCSLAVEREPAKEQSASNTLDHQETDQRVRETITALARATTSLEKERAERRRSEERNGSLAAQLQVLHRQVGQSLDQEKRLQTRITDLEKRLEDTEENLVRTQAELQREKSQRQMAEEELAALGDLNSQWESNQRLLESAKATFRQNEQESEGRLQATLAALNESEAKLQKEMAERQRLQELLGSTERKLREQTEESRSAISKIKAAREIEGLERRRMEEEVLRLRCLAMDKKRGDHNLLNGFRTQLRPALKELQETLCRLLQAGQSEEHSQFIQTALEDVLLLGAALQEVGSPEKDSSAEQSASSVSKEPKESLTLTCG